MFLSQSLRLLQTPVSLPSSQSEVAPNPVPFVTGLALGKEKERVTSVRNPLPGTDHVPQSPTTWASACLARAAVRGRSRALLTLYPTHGAAWRGFMLVFSIVGAILTPALINGSY